MILVAAVLYLVLAPGANYNVLIPTLATIGFIGIVRFWTRGAVIRYWTPPFFYLIVWGIWVLVVGLAAGNDARGIFDTAVPLVLGPVFWLLVSYGANRRTMRWIAPAIALGVIGVSLVVVATLFGIRIPVLSGLNANLSGNRFGGSGVTKVRLTSASSLLAGMPFLMALAVMERGSLRPTTRRFVFSALPIGFLGLIMAGRQAGLVTVGLTLLLIPLLPRLFDPASRQRRSDGSRRSSMRLSGTQIVVVLLGTVFAAFAATRLGINPARLVTRFLASIGLADDDTLVTAFDARSSQITVLWRDFLESPLVGHGAGATTPDSVRNVEYPWRFEMQYHLLLFEGGIVAALLFLAALRSGVRIVRRAIATAGFEHGPLLIASSVGAFAMLVANATNPYLRQVGLQVWIFLPLMLAHASQQIATRESATKVVEHGSNLTTQGLVK